MAENSNPEKIQAMMSLLSEERQKELLSRISEIMTKNSLKKDFLGKEIQMTIAYEDNEPKQYVYLKGSFTGLSHGIGQLKDGKQQPQTVVQFAFLNLEIFKEDNISSWQEYKVGADVQEKLLSDQANHEKACVKVIDNIQNFFNPEIPKYSTSEYISKFFFESRIILNATMEAYIHKQQFSEGKLDTNVFKNIYEYFSSVDFTDFTSDELEKLGFVNHENICMLIPVWAYPIVLNNHIGTQIISTDKEMVVVGIDDLDDSNRGGCIKYGFKIESLATNHD